MSRLPQRTKPAIRKVSTAQVSGQIEPAFLGGIIDIIKGPVKDVACSYCDRLPGFLRGACRAACSL